MIDPTIWEDEKFGKLSPHAQILFIGLFSNADDEGRIRLNPAYIRSTIFIYKDLSLNEIDKIITEVTQTMSHIHVYEVDGHNFAHIENWDKYQKQKTDRISPSMLPPCKLCNISAVVVAENVDNDGEEKVNLPLRIRITQRDKGCRYCGLLFPQTATRWVMEHVIPKSKGGASTDDNLVLACQWCNSKKSNRTPDEAGMILKTISEMETIWKQSGRHLEHEVKLSKVKLSKDKAADETSAAALQFLEKFNQVFGTSYRAVDPLINNLSYWLKTYNIEYILSAVEKAKTHPYWSDKMTPARMLRRKNTKGEEVDYIGDLLNSQSVGAKPIIRSKIIDQL